MLSNIVQEAVYLKCVSSLTGTAAHVGSCSSSFPEVPRRPCVRQHALTAESGNDQVATEGAPNGEQDPSWV